MISCLSFFCEFFPRILGISALFVNFVSGFFSYKNLPKPQTTTLSNTVIPFKKATEASNGHLYWSIIYGN